MILDFCCTCFVFSLTTFIVTVNSLYVKTFLAINLISDIFRKTFYFNRGFLPNDPSSKLILFMILIQLVQI